MKRRIAALAVALVAIPATASAAPDLRESQQVPSSSLGIPPQLAKPSPAAVPQYEPGGAAANARGTDVAASDQQASTRAPAPVTVSVSDSGDFSWSDAGIGAATAVSLLGISLAGGIAARRHRRPTAIAG